FLASVLGAIGPPQAQAAIGTALVLLQKAMAAPANIADTAGEAARKAEAEVIAPLLARIENAPLRDLVRGAVALLRDLAENDAAGKALRSDLKALLPRLAELGSGFLAGLVQGGVTEYAPRAFLLAAIDGLREFLSDPKGAIATGGAGLLSG